MDLQNKQAIAQAISSLFKTQDSAERTRLREYLNDLSK